LVCFLDQERERGERKIVPFNNCSFIYYRKTLNRDKYIIKKQHFITRLLVCSLIKKKASLIGNIEKKEDKALPLFHLKEFLLERFTVHEKKLLLFLFYPRMKRHGEKEQKEL